jgi:hypothetical protein
MIYKVYYQILSYIDPLQYGAWTEIATPPEDGSTNPAITTVLLGKKTVFIVGYF